MGVYLRYSQELSKSVKLVWFRMEKASLTISLPLPMRKFVEAKVRVGRFSTPSENIRSLIRDAQGVSGQSEVAALVRSGLLERAARLSRTDEPAADDHRTGERERSGRINQRKTSVPTRLKAQHA